MERERKKEKDATVVTINKIKQQSNILRMMEKKKERRRRCCHKVKERES